MPSTTSEYSDLIVRIDRWKQEVFRETIYGEDTRAQRLHTYESSHMKLRPRPTRPALGEVSGNPIRKRKAPATEAVAVTTNKAKHAKMNEPRRGRSSKGKKPQTAQEFDLPVRPESIPALGSIPALESSSRSGSPSKATTSPSRKRQATYDTSFPDAAIDMYYLGRCNPAVKQTSFSDLRLQRPQMSSSVWELHERLWETPTGFIPSALKTLYTQEANTPRKSKEPNMQSWYLEAAKTPFPSSCLGCMKKTVDIVLRTAKRTHSQKAHERQWGYVVSKLLGEVEIWQQGSEDIVVLNVESCSIQPSELRPKKPDGAARIGCDALSAKSDAKSKTASEDIERMVDWCLGMNINSDDMDLIEQAFQNSPDMECTLNQSVSYTRYNPLILDIEIKKTLQLRDPELQLAIWAAAALLKKRHHKWDTSMPMPAISINGHKWEYYIFFEMNENLMMAGPYPFGTTDCLNGIWSILYRLHVIMTWGMTRYKDWFEEQVVKPAREGRLRGTGS